MTRLHKGMGTFVHPGAASLRSPGISLCIKIHTHKHFGFLGNCILELYSTEQRSLSSGVSAAPQESVSAEITICYVCEKMEKNLLVLRSIRLDFNLHKTREILLQKLHTKETNSSPARTQAHFTLKAQRGLDRSSWSRGLNKETLGHVTH